jgi:hypothetical protein
VDQELPQPTCPECGEAVWPSDPVRVFLGGVGESETDDPELEDVFGLVAHERCASAFAERLEGARSSAR